MNLSLLAILLATAVHENADKMDSNMVWQYVAVGVVFTALGTWVVIKTVRGLRHPEKRGGGCCGCSLAETCNSRKLKESH